MAGDFIRRRNGATRHHRLRPATRPVQRCRGPHRLVWPPVGPDPVLHGLRRKILLRHRRLRILRRGMRRRRRRPTGHTGGVHLERRGGTGLLRRQRGGRLQPPHAGGGARRRELHSDGVRGGLEWRVSGGAEGEDGGEW